MTHIYTRGCEYAMRALCAMLGHEGLVSVSELCEMADIPEAFTRKMLQQLVHAGLLSSTRGPGGGFKFAKDPSEIRLSEIVEVVEGKSRIDKCILGYAKCQDENPCPLHFKWSPIRTAALDLLEDNTVANLYQKDFSAYHRSKALSIEDLEQLENEKKNKG